MRQTVLATIPYWVNICLNIQGTHESGQCVLAESMTLSKFLSCQRVVLYTGIVYFWTSQSNLDVYLFLIELSLVWHEN